MSQNQIAAEIHRPDLGSLAYVWIGNREYVTASTSEAHDLMRRRGVVHYHGRTIAPGGGSVETYTIERRTAATTGA